MTRNDTFFKILFAIQLALLPLSMAIYFLTTPWVIGLVIAGVLIVKIWMELFKNKDDKNHNLILAISNALSISSLVIFFAAKGYISTALCVFVVLFVVLMNLCKVLCFQKAMPEIIEAVDSCFLLFECLSLAMLTFLVVYELASNIALFALMLTAIVSVAYKLFYLYRYFDITEKTKNLFAKLFRRR